MQHRLWISAVASLPVGAIVGTLLGQDAHANNWSARPVYQFAVVGAVLLVPLGVFLFGKG